MVLPGKTEGQTALELGKTVELTTLGIGIVAAFAREHLGLISFDDDNVVIIAKIGDSLHCRMTQGGKETRETFYLGPQQWRWK